MLRVNVGLSRKLSRDYNSTGFSVNLDGELTAPVSDPEAVIQQMHELFDIVEEALDRQIDRSRSDEAIASRDSEPAARTQSPPAAAPSRTPSSNGGGSYRGSNGHGQQHGSPSTTNGEGATAKQTNYLLNIARRQRLSTQQLEERIEEILGQPVGVYDLSKRDAASVIDALTKETAVTGDRR